MPDLNTNAAQVYGNRFALVTGRISQGGKLMKTPSYVVAIILVIALPVFGGTKDDGWENLKHVTWQRSYTFVTRDSHCVTGEIISVTADSATLKLPKGEVTKLDRTDVLLVNSLWGYIYSGRSSWADVASYNSH